MSREVVVEVSDRRARIGLNRPEKLNALDLALVTRSRTRRNGWRAILPSTSLWCRAAGGASALAWTSTCSPPRACRCEFYRRQERGFRLLETMDKTVIAAIHGHCLGGGVQLAAACDVRVASTDAVIGLPAIDEGLFPGHGALPAATADRQRPRSIVDSHRPQIARRRGLQRSAWSITSSTRIASTSSWRPWSIPTRARRAPRRQPQSGSRAVLRGARSTTALAESEALLETCLHVTGGGAGTRGLDAPRSRRR